MDRIKVNSGSLVKLETTIDSLQDTIQNNLFKRTNTIFDTLNGVLTEDNESILYATYDNTLTVKDKIKVTAGTVMCENGDIITISNPVVLDLTALGATELGVKYCLVLSYATTGSLPVKVQSGFVYDQAGNNTAYGTKYTYYSDNYKFNVIKLNQSTDAYVRASTDFPICFFKTSATTPLQVDTTYAFLDKRTKLKFATKLFDSSVVVLKDRDSVGANKIYGTVESTVFQTPEFKILAQNNSMSMKYNTISDAYDFQVNTVNKPIRMLDKDSNVLLTIDPTTGQFEFNVKNSHLQVIGDVIVSDGTLKVNNKEVLLDAANVVAPLNVRVQDITSKSSVYGTFVTAAADELAVWLEWGYSDLLGTGTADSKFIIKNIAYAADAYFAADLFIDYYLYLPSMNKSYLITNSAATASGITTLTVIDPDTELTVNLSSVNITDPLNTDSLAWIHSNATSYNVHATLVQDTKLRKDVTLSQSVSAAYSPTRQSTILYLKTGQKFSIYVTTTSGTKESTKTYLTSSSYSKYNVMQYYDNPLIIKHASIPSTSDDSVTYISTTNGFDVQVHGWEEAENFEVIYNKTAAANFNSTAQYRTVSSSKLIDIAAVSTAAINVGVRPLIGGQEVATPVYFTVAANSVADTLTETPLISQQVSLATYRLTASAVSLNTDTGKITLTGTAITTPASIANSSTILDFPANLEGSVLVDPNGNNYVIETIYRTGSSTNVLTLTRISHTAAPSVNDVCLINTGSVRSRLLHRIQCSAENFYITNIKFDLDAIYCRTNDTNPQPVLRVYQEGKESAAESIIIMNGADGVTTLSTSLSIKTFSGYGAIIIDLYDPSDPTFTSTNLNGLSGVISLYGQRLKAANVKASVTAM